jgi:hypothetical protein
VHDLPVPAAEVVLQVACEAVRLLGHVGLLHRAEDQPQPRLGAGDLLQPAIRRAPDERLERVLAALLGEALQRGQPRARDPTAAVVPLAAGGGRRPGRERLDAVAVGSDPRRLTSRERGLDRAAQLCVPGGIPRVGVRRELGQHLGAEELERLADVLVAVAPGLQDEDDLVDTRRLVAPAQVGDLIGRADRAAQRAQALLHDAKPERGLVGGDDAAGEADLVTPGQELLVDVRAAGPVIAEDVVVGERVAEEVGAVDPALDRLGLVSGAHHRQHDGDARVDREPERDAAVRGDDRAILGDPFGRLLGLDEREAQGADALLRGEADGLAPRARDPKRRVGLLQRLGDDVALRHGHEPAVDAGERLLDHHPRDGAQRLLPLLALRVAVDAEALQLCAARRLAGAELDPSVRDEVERRDRLSHSRGVLVAGRERQDPEAEADALGALGGRREEHVRRARVRVLLEEVVLDLPDHVEADAIGDLDLLEGVLEQPVLGVLAPRPGELVLVEDAEAHPAKASRRGRPGRGAGEPRVAGAPRF